MMSSQILGHKIQRPKNGKTLYYGRVYVPHVLRMNARDHAKSITG